MQCFSWEEHPFVRPLHPSSLPGASALLCSALLSARAACLTPVCLSSRAVGRVLRSCVDYALHEKETGQPLSYEHTLAQYALCRSSAYIVIDDEVPDSFGGGPEPRPLTAVLPESVLIPDGTWRMHSLSESAALPCAC
jgi:hypothetical protein